MNRIYSPALQGNESAKRRAMAEQRYFASRARRARLLVWIAASWAAFAVVLCEVAR